MKYVWTALVIFIIAVLIAVFVSMNRTKAENDYKLCVASGGQVQESSPPICSWPDSDRESTLPASNPLF